MEVGQERYVLMSNLLLPLWNHYTISYLKKILMIEKFDKDFFIRAYYEWDVPSHGDGPCSCCSSIKFEK